MTLPVTDGDTVSSSAQARSTTPQAAEEIGK